MLPQQQESGLAPLWADFEWDGAIGRYHTHTPREHFISHEKKRISTHARTVGPKKRIWGGDTRAFVVSLPTADEIKRHNGPTHRRAHGRCPAMHTGRIRGRHGPRALPFGMAPISRAQPWRLAVTQVLVRHHPLGVHHRRRRWSKVCAGQCRNLGAVSAGAFLLEWLPLCRCGRRHSQANHNLATAGIHSFHGDRNCCDCPEGVSKVNAPSV